MINKQIDGSIVNLDEVGSVHGITLYGDGKKQLPSSAGVSEAYSMQQNDLAQEIEESDTALENALTVQSPSVQRMTAFGSE